MKNKFIMAVCLIIPGGFVLLGILAIFSPTFRKKAIDVKGKVVNSIKNSLD